jgi:hypothetical protein
MHKRLPDNSDPSWSGISIVSPPRLEPEYDDTYKFPIRGVVCDCDVFLNGSEGARYLRGSGNVPIHLLDTRNADSHQIQHSAPNIPRQYGPGRLPHK